MGKTKKVLFWIVGCLLLTACAKEVNGMQKIDDILNQESHIDVQLGEEYHQSEVKFAIKEGKAVVPKDAKWGRPEYREKNEAGIYYGEEEGGEVFETDVEITPELYESAYFDSIRKLNLIASDVQKEEYVIQVTKRAELEAFEEELRMLTGIIMKDHYELTGVKIVFDKQCRPIEKNYQLQDIDEDELNKGVVESEDYVQKFSYKTGQGTFERTLKKVKKEINQ